MLHENYNEQAKSSRNQTHSTKSQWRHNIHPIMKRAHTQRVIERRMRVRDYGYGFTLNNEKWFLWRFRVRAA
jgi:hypothetical protein